MSEVIKVGIETIEGYQYGRGVYACDVCGKPSEASAVPAFSVQGPSYEEQLCLCDDCLVAGPEKAAERMEEHIKEVECRIAETIAHQKHYLAVLKKAQSCTWKFPEIDAVRQARLKEDVCFLIDSHADGHGADLDKAIEDAKHQWAFWPQKDKPVEHTDLDCSELSF